MVVLLGFVLFGVCEVGSDGVFDKLCAAGVALLFEDFVDFLYEVFWEFYCYVACQLCHS